MKRYLRVATLAAALLSPTYLAAQSGPPAIYTLADTPITLGFTHEFRSKVLGDVRKINIYLPEHIAEPGRTFPVLVLLDGGVKEDFVHIAGLTQITAAYGQGQEMILIGVEGVDRRHDLTPPSSVAADHKVAPTSGGSEAYRRFLVDELLPWIRATFPNQGRTALMGESLAGLFVLDTMLHEPTAFDDYVSVSPSLWWDGGRLARDAAATLRRTPFAGRRLWLGLDTPPPPAEQARRERGLQDALVGGLRSSAPKGLWWRSMRFVEGHASVYHPAALQALRALYGTEAQTKP